MQRSTRGCATVHLAGCDRLTSFLRRVSWITSSHSPSTTTYVRVAGGDIAKAVLGSIIIIVDVLCCLGY